MGETDAPREKMDVSNGHIEAPVTCGQSSSIGRSLLREYASEISPQNATIEHPEASSASSAAERERPQTSGSSSSEVPPTLKDLPARAPTSNMTSTSTTSTPRPSPFLQLQQNKSFLKHRKAAHSADAIPRQTILKALASRPPPSTTTNHHKQQQHPPAMTPSLNGLVNTPNGHAVDSRGSGLSSQRLTAALSELALSPGLSSAREGVPTAAETKFNLLQSPCFFHQRFDDAVNLDKVLEEIVDDEWMSHSRLMQTATGVREVSKQLQRRPIRRAVRNVMIVTKARDNHLVMLTRDVAEWLLSTPRYGSERGVNVYVDAKLRNSRRFDAAGLVEKDSTNFSKMLRYWTPELCWTAPEQFDLVITLGGDGTVLFTSWLFQRIVPPILSFSLGSLGFLTNFEFAHYKEQLDRVMGESGMRVSLRMRFTCTVYRRGAGSASASSSTESTAEMEEGEQFEVLNELVIDRGPSPYVSNLELYGDDQLLTVVQADGCIFSTPTGSTAYSLSAGGSLVHPDIPAILLTPICPHTLSFRPMLLNDTMLLRVCVPAASRATAYCSFDGKGRIELRQGDFVTIAASQYPFPTVLAKPTEWFDSISRTLRWNTRGAAQRGWNARRTHIHGGDDEDETEGDLAEDDEWDIDTVDSGVYTATSSSEETSPLKRQMSLLLS